MCGRYHFDFAMKHHFCGLPQQLEVNEEVKSGQYIANTGSSGAVFGDHLHFGVLIQGIEVNPIEWLSKYWVRENITKTINNAKKVINNK